MKDFGDELGEIGGLMVLEQEMNTKTPSQERRPVLLILSVFVF